MSSPNDASRQAQARAGRSKRERTRQALLAAADRRFRVEGWLGTRMEDIAADAGTSTATAFNHFPARHALIGAVFAPYVNPEIDRAARLLADGRGPAQVLDQHVQRLAVIAREHQGLTVAFTAAVQEYTVRSGGPPDPADPVDPRNAAPLPRAVMMAIQLGQARGEFRLHPSARDLGPEVINLLLLRCLTRPGEQADETAELLLTMLFGTLDPGLLAAAGRDGRPFRIMSTP